ncbi:MAG: hypothetical protein FWG70_11410 [Oscillospiraceae bacterium]|nr:hypothetical protein [Oscillospiraceae bacterium]
MRTDDVRDEWASGVTVDKFSNGEVAVAGVSGGINIMGGWVSTEIRTKNIRKRLHDSALKIVDSPSRICYN